MEAQTTPEQQKTLDVLAADVQKVAQELGVEMKKRDDELQKYGKATEETGKKVDELFESFRSLQAAQVEEAAKTVKRIDEVEAMLKRPGAGGRNEEDAKSIAEEFLASESLKRCRENNARTSDPVIFKSLRRPSASKTLLETTAATRLIAPQRDPIILAPQRVLRIRDLMPSRPTSKSSGEYIRETGFNNGVAAAVTSITRTSSTATLTTTAAHGWGPVGQQVVITVAGADQAGYNGTHTATIASTTTVTYEVDSGTVTPATGTITAYKRQTHGAAATVAEGGTKPEARMQFDLETWNARKIAHWLPITNEIRDDDAQLMAIIEDRLLYGLEYVEEQQILYGDGTGSNLAGILVNANRQQYAWSAGETLPVPDTKIDAIRRGMTMVQIAEYMASGLVMHPFDFEDIELAKGTDGHYLAISTIDNAGVRRFFQIPIVVTSAIEAGTALAGAFAQGAHLWDKEEGAIRIADQHSTYFTENKLAVLAEERVGLALYRPEAFVEITFDAAPS